MIKSSFKITARLTCLCRAKAALIQVGRIIVLLLEMKADAQRSNEAETHKQRILFFQKYLCGVIHDEEECALS